MGFNSGFKGLIVRLVYVLVKIRTGKPLKYKAEWLQQDRPFV